MSKTYIYNNKRYDFNGLDISVTGTSDTWVYQHTSSSLITMKFLIGLINQNFNAFGYVDTPHFDYNNFDNITLIHASNGLIYDDVIGLDITINGNLNGQYVLGVYDRLQSTLSSYNQSVSTLPYSGFSRLKVRFKTVLEEIYNISLGVTKSTPYQVKRLGEDFISYNGVESNSYNTIGGYTHLYRMVSSSLQEYNSFINACIDSEVNFENDTNNIGRGFTYYIHAHKNESFNVIYDFLDIIEVEFSLLKKDDFITL